MLCIELKCRGFSMEEISFVRNARGCGKLSGDGSGEPPTKFPRVGVQDSDVKVVAKTPPKTPAGIGLALEPAPWKAPPGVPPLEPAPWKAPPNVPPLGPPPRKAPPNVPQMDGKHEHGANVKGC